MNYITDGIFKYIKPDFKKLVKFGFTEADGAYLYRKQILGGQMILKVSVSKSGELEAHTFDCDTGDEYTLHTVRDAAGEFVGKVRSEYTEALQKIADACFETQVFKSRQLADILAFTENKFGDLPEFLWEDTPDCCILRRKDNRKWYAVFMVIDGEKLGLEEGRREIIDIRCDPDELDKLVDGVRYFRGWHMNKKHWLTLVLDGRVENGELFDRIKTSYGLAKKK